MKVLTEIKPVNGRAKKQRNTENFSSGQDQSMDSSDNKLRKKRKLREITTLDLSQNDKNIES